MLADEKRKPFIAQVSECAAADIQFAISRLLVLPRPNGAEFRNSVIIIESEHGVRLGQKLQPVTCAGCYVPGGRYVQAASAIMSVRRSECDEVREDSHLAGSRSGGKQDL